MEESEIFFDLWVKMTSLQLTSVLLTYFVSIKLFLFLILFCCFSELFISTYILACTLKGHVKFSKLEADYLKISKLKADYVKFSKLKADFFTRI
jgi:hypothetical protein